METKDFPTAGHRGFEALYEQYAPEIKRFIFTICRRDPALTEDLFQSAWLNAWRGLGTLKDEGAVRAWLYAIARNEARRHFYKNRADLGLGEADGENEPADEASSRFPEAFADKDLVSRLLGRLGAGEQQLILLHYAYDMSLKDIAGLYGANYNTVKSGMRRAIAKLKYFAGAQMGKG
jgi:RNA polymerase sigma-70 factor (ECF subfamily)